MRRRPDPGGAAGAPAAHPPIALPATDTAAAPSNTRKASRLLANLPESTVVDPFVTPTRVTCPGRQLSPRLGPKFRTTFVMLYKKYDSIG
jgi:hypothetical protein